MSRDRIDRRSFPRYPLTFPVNVKLDENGEADDFITESVNLSRSSIEIACTNELIEQLIAQEQYPHTCQISFQIPNRDHLFKVDSQVVTHRRLSQNLFHLVLIFPDFATKKGDLLGEYLNQLQFDDKNQGSLAS